MTDVHSPAQRSKNMAAIRCANTKPEIQVRRLLHDSGYRFRLHRRDLPGRPDIVLPRYKAAIFVNGCFWHMHDCEWFRMPRTRPEFWREKLLSNRRRDQQNLADLQATNWRVAVVWECSLRNGSEGRIESMRTKLCEWIDSESDFMNLESPES